MIWSVLGLLVGLVLLILEIMQTDTQIINIVIWALFILYNFYEMYFYRKK